MKTTIHCIKCAKEMMQQSITETDGEILEVYYCKDCKTEILLTKEKLNYMNCIK